MSSLAAAKKAEASSQTKRMSPLQAEGQLSAAVRQYEEVRALLEKRREREAAVQGQIKTDKANDKTTDDLELSLRQAKQETREADARAIKAEDELKLRAREAEEARKAAADREEREENDVAGTLFFVAAVNDAINNDAGGVVPLPFLRRGPYTRIGPTGGARRVVPPTKNPSVGPKLGLSTVRSIPAGGAPAFSAPAASVASGPK